MNELATAVEHAPAIPDAPLSLATVIARVNLVQQVFKELMQKDVHYGPGYPGDKKVNLLKPGAEKLCLAFGLVPHAEVRERDLPNGHREYTVVVRLKTASGHIAGEGMGICSSMEAKHRFRWAKPKCPECHNETVIKTSRGWWCPAEKGGCGCNPDPKAVESQELGKVENPNPADTFNAVLKVGHKRALVHGTIQATAASDFFSQDAEDIAEKADRHDATERNAAPAAAPTQQTPTAAPTQPQTKATAPAPTTKPAPASSWTQDKEDAAAKALGAAVGATYAPIIWRALSQKHLLPDGTPDVAKVQAQREERLQAISSIAAFAKNITDTLPMRGEGAEIVADQIKRHLITKPGADDKSPPIISLDRPRVRSLVKRLGDMSHGEDPGPMPLTFPA